jgi:hypothetical protein
MKAIWLILQSYFYRRFILLFVVGMIVFLISANILLYAARQPELAWCYFLYAATMTAAGIGFHLRQSLESCEVDLLQNYRQRHLIAAGIILTVLTIWPVLLTALRGGPVLLTLAAYLFFECLALWIAIFGASRMGVPSAIGFCSIIWAFHDVWNLMPWATPGVSRIAQLASMIGPDWEIYTIAASVLGFLIFAIYYLRASCMRLANEFENDFWKCYKTQDNVDSHSMNAAAKNISRLSRKLPNESPGSYRSIRLIQIGLFSPGSVVASFNSFFTAIFIGVSLTFCIYLVKGMIFFALTYGYFVISVLIAGDFYSHRNRLPAIYLQSRLSRKSFMRTTIWALMLIFLRGMLNFTVVMAVSNELFSLAVWTRFFQLCLGGIAVGFFQVSLGLLIKDRAISSAIKALIYFLPIIALLVLSPLYSHWLYIAAIAIAGCFLFLPAIRFWGNSELDPSNP